MNNEQIVEINVPRMMHQLTMKVQLHGMRELAVRVCVAAYLIRLAAWVMGASVTIEAPDTGTDPRSR